MAPIGTALSDVQISNTTTQTGTVGLTWIISPTITNDLRFNYSHTNSDSYSYMDKFGGAVPLTSLPFTGAYPSLTLQNSQLFIGLLLSIDDNPHRAMTRCLD